MESIASRSGGWWQSPERGEAGGGGSSGDRFGRDLRHLVNTVEDPRTRGVGLKVLTGAGAQIDTTTANGRLAFGIFAAFADDAVSAVMRSRSLGPERTAA
jgi:hypothetical protein